MSEAFELPDSSAHLEQFDDSTLQHSFYVQVSRIASPPRYWLRVTSTLTDPTAYGFYELEAAQAALREKTNDLVKRFGLSVTASYTKPQSGYPVVCLSLWRGGYITLEIAENKTTTP